MRIRENVYNMCLYKCLETVYGRRDIDTFYLGPPRECTKQHHCFTDGNGDKDETMLHKSKLWESPSDHYIFKNTKFTKHLTLGALLK